MEEILFIKQFLESEQKYISFLIESGSSENKILREKLLDKNKQELKNITEQLNKKCNHSVIITDYVEDSRSNMIKISYCNNCGLNLR